MSHSHFHVRTSRSGSEQLQAREHELAMLKANGYILIIDDDKDGPSAWKFGLRPDVAQVEFFHVISIASQASSEEIKSSFSAALSEFIKKHFVHHPPNIVLLDCDLRLGLSPMRHDGPELIPTLRALLPQARIIGHTNRFDEPGMAERFGGTVLGKLLDLDCLIGVLAAELSRDRHAP